MAFSINIKGTLVHSAKPWIMGIVNATPDSFYSGSRVAPDSFEAQVDSMVAAGADVLDVGGASSRPGASPVSSEEEAKRVLPIVKYIAMTHPQTWISIDTFHTSVAEQAIQAGAHMVNDITFGEGDETMAKFIGKSKTPYIGMHMQGNPETMQVNPRYEEVVADVARYLLDRKAYFLKQGAVDVILDPGFGFGKTLEHNYTLLKHTSYLKELVQAPILLGVSRKSMIYKALNIEPEEALNGSTVLHTFGLLEGADILRVHDVKEAREARDLVEKLKTI